MRFGPATVRRYTRTVYGLSLWAGVHMLLGTPTDFATVALDADVALRRISAPEERGAGGPAAGGPPLF